MADIVITAANVTPGTDCIRDRGIAGATITAGQPVYKDATDSNKLKLADADVEATAAGVGIALHGAAAGQPLDYAIKGTVNIGATVVVGQVYVVSTTAGGIAPIADLLSGDFVCILGVGATASTLKMGLNATGVAKA